MRMPHDMCGGLALISAIAPQEVGGVQCGNIKGIAKQIQLTDIYTQSVTVPCVSALSPSGSVWVIIAWSNTIIYSYTFILCTINLQM